MTEPTELLPCPFCGGINIIHCGHHMYCHACGADGPDADSQHESEAITAWNTRTPQPTQAQAGAVPLTPIRKAALDLYTPPFRCEHGYVRDANNQMVADDSGEEMVGVIAARIRGWGRIKYMDNPKGHAAALQDEVGEIVAQALNEHWATHGIKGGQCGRKQENIQLQKLTKGEVNDVSESKT